jgi:hypothetical protein
MPILNERVYASEFLLAEAPGYRSRDQVTVDQNQNLSPGAVIGFVTVGALSDTVTPKVGNTGNGVLTPVAPAAGVTPGKYRAVFTDPTHFQVFRPDLMGDAVLDGEGQTGLAYNGAVSFTIAAGATAFAEGDEIDLVVTAAAGDGNAVAWNPNALDGSQHVGGVLYAAAVTAAGQTMRQTAITRDAEVKTAMLQFAVGLNAGQQAAAIASLAKLGIIARA